MRRRILTFFRNGNPVAKLLRDLSGSGMTVEKWTWEGERAFAGTRLFAGVREALQAELKKAAFKLHK